MIHDTNNMAPQSKDTASIYIPPYRNLNAKPTTRRRILPLINGWKIELFAVACLAAGAYFSAPRIAANDAALLAEYCAAADPQTETAEQFAACDDYFHRQQCATDSECEQMHPDIASELDHMPY